MCRVLLKQLPALKQSWLSSEVFGVHAPLHVGRGEAMGSLPWLCSCWLFPSWCCPNEQVQLPLAEVALQWMVPWGPTWRTWLPSFPSFSLPAVGSCTASSSHKKSLVCVSSCKLLTASSTSYMCLLGAHLPVCCYCWLRVWPSRPGKAAH